MGCHLRSHPGCPQGHPLGEGASDLSGPELVSLCLWVMVDPGKAGPDSTSPPDAGGHSDGKSSKPVRGGS